ncbi:TPA: beta-glucosidase [Vibrio vulnificus]|uniref:GH1 family beta-glucosidase n=1 Tax=Vibrio vulnificus TaxID=672 RepID=UPI001028F9EF|nr:GH1 family beta-glucosidase [Vibrio vulnificus]EHZ7121859.1 beta-glucosidase [Vibrio vulnificus]ELE1905119.1 beta-glucosidase [Vibrio vulnificus]MCU8182992.1 GH1 family beta-glucosidase [Vibrio vulnificus]MCU8358221.1 GH1 family beta-glucosidase [Vibrio vulnificus]RZR07030.1 beta-glucosidase [Vibrio vulnificus]
MNKYQLPQDSQLRQADFLFGVATSSYQIEGGAQLGGRTPSIWDTFCNQPGAVDNMDNGDVACDHFHLWQQDIALIQGLGVDAYRLSMAWPRILPHDGQVNQEGLKFYERIIDECHARGLKVFVTLYHWDLPQYLEDKGGWLNRETAYKFAEYAEVVSGYFGNKIDSYATLNEPFCSAYLGYRWGIHAPGKKGEREGFLSAHHLMLAHGLAMPIMRKNAPQSMHGCVFNATPAYPYSEQDVAAAQYSDAEGFHWFIDPVLKGEYPQSVLERQAHNMPMILDGDLDIIRGDLDFIGINFYTRCVVRFDANGALESIPQTDAEHTYIGWEIYPQALTDLLLRLKQRYPNLPPVYITENGAAGEDTCINGEVNDEQRVRYFQSHLLALDEAIRAGVNVQGYFAWSLMDNFEWAYGYKQRFGIVHVDYATQKRTLKQSAIAYRNTLLARAEEKQ